MLSDDSKERVRSATDIVEIIGDRVTLRQRGQNHIGLCPFHQEKTPSFNVNAQRQTYHCFGCGAGGDVFTFVMEMDAVSFPEALRTLADRAGVVITQEKHKGGSGNADVLDSLYAANSIASELYQNILKEPERGKGAQEYLKSRGISGKTAGRFALGFAPPGWSTLLDQAKANGIGPKVLMDAGLVVKNESGGYYDRFRDRIVFPIANTSGRVVGFGARTMDPENPAKYLNSSETAIYNKSKMLYGLKAARDTIRREKYVIVVEGYMDFLKLAQEGIENVVASCGTALTPENAVILGRHSERIVLVFDGDSAGIRAALKAGDTLLSAGQKADIVMLPDGEDPDSYVSTKGPDSFRTLVDSAVDFLKFRWDQAVEAHGLETVDARHAVVSDVLDSVALVDDDFRRDMYAREVSDKALTSEVLVLKAVAKRRKKRTSTSDDEPTPARPTRWTAASAEKGLLALMLGRADVCRYVAENLDVDRVNDRTARSLISSMIDVALEGGVPSVELLSISEPTNEVSSALMEISVTEIAGSGQDILEDHIARISLAGIEAQLVNVGTRQKAASQGSPEYDALTKEWRSLTQELTSLYGKIDRNAPSLPPPQ